MHIMSRIIYYDGMFETLLRLFYWLHRTASNYAIVMIQNRGWPKNDKVFFVPSQIILKNHAV